MALKEEDLSNENYFMNTKYDIYLKWPSIFWESQLNPFTLMRLENFLMPYLEVVKYGESYPHWDHEISLVAVYPRTMNTSVWQRKEFYYALRAVDKMAVS